MRLIRWPIAILITVAVAIGYLDRQTLALTTKAIQQDIPLSDNDFGNLQSLFYFAYALMYVGGGKLMDLLGSRRGFLLIVVWWSLACAGHGLAGGLLMLAAARLMLGLAQGGTFPASGQGRRRVVSGPGTSHRHGHGQRRQFGRCGRCPACRRPGPVLRPVALGLLSERRDRAVLDRLVAVGLLPAGPAPATLRGRTPRDPRGAGLRCRCTKSRRFLVAAAAPCRKSGEWCWARPVATPCGSPISPGCPSTWSTCAGFDTAQIGSIAWIPYAASGMGSVAGGWCSSRLLRSGYSLNFSRKVVLGACAAVMPCMCLVTHVPVRVEIALFSIAFFAHLSFSTLVITLPADLFPRGMVGSVVGLVGFGGSMGGVLFNKFAGSLLDGVGREPAIPCSSRSAARFTSLGFLWILLTIRNIRPIALDLSSARK